MTNKRGRKFDTSLNFLGSIKSWQNFYWNFDTLMEFDIQSHGSHWNLGWIFIERGDLGINRVYKSNKIQKCLV